MEISNSPKIRYLFKTLNEETILFCSICIHHQLQHQPHGNVMFHDEEDWQLQINVLFIRCCGIISNIVNQLIRLNILLGVLFFLN